MKNKNNSEIENILTPIMSAINWSYISRKLGKTPQWLTQRIHGCASNGRPVEMKAEQREALRRELYQLGAKIMKVADNI